MPRSLRARSAMLGLWFISGVACAQSQPSTVAPPTTRPATAATAPGPTELAPTTASAAATELESLNSAYLSGYRLSDADHGTEVTVTVTDGVRIIESNGLPNHPTGEFPNPGNPHTITAQVSRWEYPLEPTRQVAPTESRQPGVSITGVPFEPGTAETITCASGEVYRVEAFGGVADLGFDDNNAHVQPDGSYHYHGTPVGLLAGLGHDADLVHVGFAADGHLIAHSPSDRYAPSYRLDTTPRTGSSCLVSLPGSATIDLEGTIPDGAVTSDWVYDPTVGDLDECNGLAIGDTYFYLVTDTFPYAPRCLWGSVDEPAPNATPDAPTPIRPDLAAIAASLGVDEDALARALGPPPPDVERAARLLDIDPQELAALLGVPR